MKKISICLWFDSEAEEAARFYTSVFKNSRILHTNHYTEAGHEIHGQPKGKVQTVTFEIEGYQITALNGGSYFKLSEAASLMVACENQDEVDYYWNKLSEGGPKESQQCGWLKDKYGLSWQIVPSDLHQMITDQDPQRSSAVMNAILKMKKLDLMELRRISGRS